MSLLARLLYRSEKNAATGCWEWNGYRDAKGYGFIFTEKINGRAENERVHRVSYQLHRGEIPDGFCVCHKCDNPACWNPFHLFLETIAGNNADRDAKGRQRSRSGDGNGSRTHPERLRRGESHPMAKLTLSDVRLIRLLRERGVSVLKLAAQFSVGKSTVKRVVNRKNWKEC